MSSTATVADISYDSLMTFNDRSKEHDIYTHELTIEQPIKDFGFIDFTNGVRMRMSEVNNKIRKGDLHITNLAVIKDCYKQWIKQRHQKSR